MILARISGDIRRDFVAARTKLIFLRDRVCVFDAVGSV